jgi:hypothetical protein
MHINQFYISQNLLGSINGPKPINNITACLRTQPGNTLQLVLSAGSIVTSDVTITVTYRGTSATAGTATATIAAGGSFVSVFKVPSWKIGETLMLYNVTSITPLSDSNYNYAATASC